MAGSSPYFGASYKLPGRLIEKRKWCHCPLQQSSNISGTSMGHGRSTRLLLSVCSSGMYLLLVVLVLMLVLVARNAVVAVVAVRCVISYG